MICTTAWQAFVSEVTIEAVLPDVANIWTLKPVFSTCAGQACQSFSSASIDGDPFDASQETTAALGKSRAELHEVGICTVAHSLWCI